ncbi:MAG: 2-C-methyl-D-erythritol 4-phosphate cytidylyltransferase [Angelakisella sp.]
MVSGIILAGGSSTRYGTGENKTLVELLGRPVLEYSLRVFLGSPAVDEVILAARAGEEATLRALAESLSPEKPVTVVTGGKDRAESVQNALTAAKGERVLIHDGARPLVTKELLEDCLAALAQADGAAVAVASPDTVKLTGADGYVERSTDRSRTYLIQTPQAFYREELLALHRALGDGPERGQITDDCMLLERAGRRVKLVPGRRENIKITTPADRELAEFYLKKGTE